MIIVFITHIWEKEKIRKAMFVRYNTKFAFRSQNKNSSRLIDQGISL